MTHPRTTPQAAIPGLPRLRPVVSCGVRAAALMALACFAALMVPLCVDVSSLTVNVQRNQAYADETNYEGSLASEYIDLMADESGLSRNDFVAVTVGTLSAVTGVQFAANPGIRLLDNVAGDNLDYLIDAADYPAWDSLSSTEQARYGNSANYSASKYMSLMNAFGFDEDFQRYEDYVSSGGGHFLFEDETKDRLGRIGKIGERWKDNIAVAFGDLVGLITNRNAVNDYFGSNADSISFYFDANNIEEWPSTVSKEIALNYGSNFQYKSDNGGSRKNFTVFVSNTDVYFVLFMNRNNGNNYGYWNGFISMFNDVSFKYNYASNSISWPNPAPTTNSAEVNYNDEKYYRFTSSGSVLTRYPSGNFESTFEYNYLNGNESDSDIQKAISIMATHRENVVQEGGEVEPDIPNYPIDETIPDNTDVYFPPSGLNPSTTWNNFITVQRPTNPFNPDDQTATPEWQQETKQNVEGLSGIHFDKLFPFSMIYSIPNLVNVVRGGIATDSQSKNVVQVPFRWSDTYTDELYLDLTDLVNLLVMVRPFNRILLVFALLMALVLFWKSILTGD